MHIAYNAFEDQRQSLENDIQTPIQSKLNGYYIACEKYAKEIAAIRNYFPGWMPALTFQN